MGSSALTIGSLAPGLLPHWELVMELTPKLPRFQDRTLVFSSVLKSIFNRVEQTCFAAGGASTSPVLK
jgi:hypothetical protein